MNDNNYYSKRDHRHGHTRFDRHFEKEDRCFKHRHGGRGGFGGDGDGKRFFKRGAFKYALLELLAKEPMHGYQMIKEMEEKTGGLYSPSPGSIYPNLQLLEDMEFIGYSETDGKKLYHITNAGLAHLREREEAESEQSKGSWEHRGQHRMRGGRGGRHSLRCLMKEWSEVVHVMAALTEAAKENPNTKQAEQFQQLMNKLQKDLQSIAKLTPNSTGEDESGRNPADEPSKQQSNHDAD